MQCSSSPYHPAPAAHLYQHPHPYQHPHQHRHPHQHQHRARPRALAPAHPAARGILKPESPRQSAREAPVWAGDILRELAVAEREAHRWPAAWRRSRGSSSSAGSRGSSSCASGGTAHARGGTPVALSPAPRATPAPSPARAPSAPAVHARAVDDAHYPFALARKARTKPRSGACVWCVARALLARRGCPALRARAPGRADADWHRWLREMRTVGLWDALARSVAPAPALRAADPRFDPASFAPDLAAAVLECALRALRDRAPVPQRDLMAQARSAKAHKVPRLAADIAAAYAAAGD